MIVVELNKIKLYAKHSFIGPYNKEDYKGYKFNTIDAICRNQPHHFRIGTPELKIYILK